LVPRTRVLIVCEGAKTEPAYFLRFPAAEVIDLEVVGPGLNTDGLVAEAIKRRNRAEADGHAFNEVWCVFDRDSFTPQNFNRALRLAENERIRFAVSNEAFELWYLLHFDFHDAGISRATYEARLTRALGVPYRKNIPDMYERLKERQPAAIRNAEKLLNRYVPWNPARDHQRSSFGESLERVGGVSPG
jgi:hypothetical protein